MSSFFPRALLRYGNTVLCFSGRAELFFYLLLWLMVLLVAGTVSEKYVGLYAAQQLFFSSFIIWVGGLVPVPGGTLTLTLIFISLLAKLIIERWTRQKIGTAIVHGGALLLLIGGFITAVSSTGGNMVIAEGASSNFISDEHHRELAITETQSRQESVFPEKQLEPGQVLTAPVLPFKITVAQVYDNIGIKQRPQMLTDGSVHGMLVANEVSAAPTQPEEEKNLPGIVFKVTGAGKSVDGSYAIFDGMPVEQHIKAGGKTYTVALRRQRTVLPFHVKLVKFTRETYPGTDKPRGFASEVILTDGPATWHSLISMNNPMRYKGYTFYQSSFIEGGDGRTTILAVVKNFGAIFPYVSSLIICLGLLVHLFIRLPGLTGKRSAR